MAVWDFNYVSSSEFYTCTERVRGRKILPNGLTLPPSLALALALALLFSPSPSVSLSPSLSHMYRCKYMFIFKI